MESENTVFLQALRIKDVQLCELRNGETFIQDQGSLFVFYSQSLDLFILKIHNQKWVLDRNLSIIGTFSLAHDAKVPTYLIPNPAGFFMFKVFDSNPGVHLTNFETILQNTASFTRRNDLERQLASFSTHRKEGVLEKTKEGVMDALGAITKAFSHVEIDSLPNQKFVRSFDEIKQLDSVGCPVADISNAEIRTLKNENEFISQNCSKTGVWKEFIQGPGPLSGQIDLLNMGGTTTNVGGTQSFGQAIGGEDTGNIDKKRDPTGMDNQGIVGAENQRLPAYECHTTKAQVQEGLAQASANLEYGTEDLPPHMQESYEFGVGLMWGPELTDHQINEIQSGSKSNLETPSSKTNIDAPFATNINQPNVALKTEKSGTWSVMANPPLSTQVSDFDVAAGGTQKSLDIPFSSTSGLGEVSNKSLFGSQATSTSEKQSSVNKPVDKENVGGTVTI